MHCARGRSPACRYEHAEVYPATPENCPALAAGVLGQLLSSPAFINSTEDDITSIFKDHGWKHEGAHGRFLIWNMPILRAPEPMPGDPEDNAVYLTIQDMLGQRKAVHIGKRTCSAYAFHAIADTLLAFEKTEREERWPYG